MNAILRLGKALGDICQRQSPLFDGIEEVIASLLLIREVGSELSGQGVLVLVPLGQLLLSLADNLLDGVGVTETFANLLHNSILDDLLPDIGVRAQVAFVGLAASLPCRTAVIPTINVVLPFPRDGLIPREPSSAEPTEDQPIQEVMCPITPLLEIRPRHVSSPPIDSFRQLRIDDCLVGAVDDDPFILRLVGYAFLDECLGSVENHPPLIIRSVFEKDVMDGGLLPILARFGADSVPVQPPGDGIESVPLGVLLIDSAHDGSLGRIGFIFLLDPAALQDDGNAPQPVRRHAAESIPGLRRGDHPPEGVLP